MYLMILHNLQRLEEAAKTYYLNKTQYLGQQLSFDFVFFMDVYHSIKSMPLDSKKIELMERFHKNVFTPVSTFHPKLNYFFNFTNDIAHYGPLITQLDSLHKQATDLFNHYFDIEKPLFDWPSFHDARAQISNMTQDADKLQLMQLFENVVITMSQIEPKTYANFSFAPELEEKTGYQHN